MEPVAQLRDDGGVSGDAARGRASVRKGAAPGVPLAPDQIKELQSLLNRAGYKVGEIDGGSAMARGRPSARRRRSSDLPADSYPTLELIERLKGARG